MVTCYLTVFIIILYFNGHPELDIEGAYHFCDYFCLVGLSTHGFWNVNRCCQIALQDVCTNLLPFPPTSIYQSLQYIDVYIVMPSRGRYFQNKLSFDYESSYSSTLNKEAVACLYITLVLRNVNLKYFRMKGFSF